MQADGTNSGVSLSVKILADEISMVSSVANERAGFVPGQFE